MITEKGLTGDKGDPGIVQGLIQQLAAVDIFRQGQPDEHAAFGSCIRHGFGHEFIQSGQHRIAFGAIGIADGIKMPRKQSARRTKGDFLIDGRHMQITGLLHQHQPFDHRTGRRNPANPKGGHQRFGKCAKLNNGSGLWIAIGFIK